MNSLSKNFTPYSLEGNLEFVIKLLVILSGITLFFYHLKPFKKINTYFSIYILAGIFFIIGLLFRGIPGAIIISIIIFPIIPNNKKYENNGIIISAPFQGFMAPCLTYQIKERKFLIFEKNYGVFELDEGGPIDFESICIEQSESGIEVTYTTVFDEGIVKKKRINR